MAAASCLYCFYDDLYYYKHIFAEIVFFSSRQNTVLRHRTRQNTNNCVTDDKKYRKNPLESAALRITGQTEAKAPFCGLPAHHKC